jgi:hypothetical protein
MEDNHHKLRQEAVNYLENTPRGRQYVDQNATQLDADDIYEYLPQAARKPNDGDEHTLFAITQRYKIIITVYQYQRISHGNWILNTAMYYPECNIDELDPSTLPTLQLTHSGGDHYDPMFPINEARIDSHLPRKLNSTDLIRLFTPLIETDTTFCEFPLERAIVEPCDCSSETRQGSTCNTSTCANSMIGDMCITCSRTCFNKNGHHKEYPTSVRSITNKYNGLFTESFVTAGHLIAEYTGVLRTQKHYDKIIKNNPQADGYAAALLDYDAVIDARTFGSIARFANHSCSPNCELAHILCGNKRKVYIRALTNIGIHQEITVDYEWTYDAKTHPTITQCKCQTANCQGTIEKNPPQGIMAHISQQQQRTNVSTSTKAQTNPATGNLTLTNAPTAVQELQSTTTLTAQQQQHINNSSTIQAHRNIATENVTPTTAPTTPPSRHVLHHIPVQELQLAAIPAGPAPNQKRPREENNITNEPATKRKQTYPTQHTFIQRMQGLKRDRELNQYQSGGGQGEAKAKKQRSSEYRPP